MTQKIGIFLAAFFSGAMIVGGLIDYLYDKGQGGNGVCIGIGILVGGATLLAVAAAHDEITD